MITLQEVLKKKENEGGLGQSLQKHLAAVNINTWYDITRMSLYDLKDHLAESVAPSTARRVASNMRTVINHYAELIPGLPEDWKAILKFKSVKPKKIYLTEAELQRLENTTVRTEKQQWVKNVFLICAYTGLRVSDAEKLTSANIKDESIHFVAQKTKKAGVVPMRPGTDMRIRWIEEHPVEVSRMYYNHAIRLICKKAKINEQVTVVKGGEEITGPKWQFVSSHTARISTASCLAKRGVDVGEIQGILQHSSPMVTTRYIVRDEAQLSGKAMAFFGK